MIHLEKPEIPDSVFVAPTATLVGKISLGNDASIWFGSVIRGDINEIKIGASTNIQDGCLLHVTNKHPLVLGQRITVGHGAILHGCTIGDDCLIAMGAIVLDGAVVGSGCIVGAGCLVPPGMKVPDSSLVLGSPGKIVRELTDDDRKKIDTGWRNYVEYARQYKDSYGK